MPRRTTGGAEPMQNAPVMSPPEVTREDAPAVVESSEPEEATEVVFEMADLAVSYGGAPAIEGVSFDIGARRITAIIGPSGCGKSTLLRCFNRMNDLILGAVVHGKLTYHGVDLYGPKVDAVEVRRRIGMVFQKPNPFPKSIFDNVAFGPRLNGKRRGLDEVVEGALVRA